MITSADAERRNLMANILKVRSDDAALKHNQKMLASGKTQTIYVGGHGYEGKIIAINPHPANASHEIEFEYTHAWPMSDPRTRREELR
jgi:hypothetical protein